MTRFKPLRRIEHALEHNDTRELEWALWYVKDRLSRAPLKVHIRAWEKRRRRIEAELGL